MIRNAENFIYIENQYFLGSAYAWLNDFETNADHPIPAEIAQKVKLSDHWHCLMTSSFDVRKQSFLALQQTRARFCKTNFAVNQAAQLSHVFYRIYLLVNKGSWKK